MSTMSDMSAFYLNQMFAGLSLEVAAAIVVRNYIEAGIEDD